MIKLTARLGLLAAGTLTVCLSVAGCSSSSSSGHSSAPPSPPTTSAAGGATGSSASSAPSAGSASITIKDFAYKMSGAVPAGSKVKVTNNDATAHTVTADSGNAFDVTIQPGKTSTLTAPKQPGPYKFHCTFHSNMHGTLTVTK